MSVAAPIRDRIVELRRVRASDLQAHPTNWRIHPDPQRAAVSRLLSSIGYADALLAYTLPDGSLRLFDGHLRKALTPDAEVPVLITDLTEAEAAVMLKELDPLAGLAEADEGLLASLTASIDGFVDAGLLESSVLLGDLLAGIGEPESPTGNGSPPTDPRRTLSDRFGVPPFSVLDARQGYWQERKRAWIALGIQSELGRGEGIVPNGTRLDASQDGCYERGYGKPTGLLGFSQQAQDYRQSTGDYAKSGAVMPPGTEGGMAQGEQALRHRQKANACPGGSQRPAASLGADGKTRRGDGRGKPAAEDFGSGGPGTLDGQRKAWREDGGHSASHAEGLTVHTTTDPVRVSRQDAEPTPAESGTSIFDPVLCELVYRWFSPQGALILDPFAGGSVRGIVAAKTGRTYLGLDLSERQIAANEEQAEAICDTIRPAWKVGDSRDVKALAEGAYDLIFSCPPYGDLEVYSDDPRDLSKAEYPAFIAALRQIVGDSVAMLKPDRFAVFTVGDFRDGKGFYRNFVSDTIAAFQDAGAFLYNEAILVTAVGSLPIRIGKQFGSYRKLGKTHQNVLVFLKGDPKRIPSVLGECDFGEVNPEPED